MHETRACRFPLPRYTLFVFQVTMKMTNELKTSFLGALQASLSVLLVLSYGVVAAQFDIIKGSTTKQISTICVRMFLPALLVTNVGTQLHADTGSRYIPILGKHSTTQRARSLICASLGSLLYVNIHASWLRSDSSIQASIVDYSGD